MHEEKNIVCCQHVRKLFLFLDRIAAMCVICSGFKLLLSYADCIVHIDPQVDHITVEPGRFLGYIISARGRTG